MRQSFKQYDKYEISVACIFIASKAEETKRNLDHVLKIGDECMKCGEVDPKSDEYQRKLNRLIDHELIILQTVGFDVRIEHPFEHIERAVQFMQLSTEIGHTIELFCTNSIFLTTFCVEMMPEIVAATCVYLVLHWSGSEMGSELNM